MSSESWAQASNTLVYSAILVLFAAMIAFAVSFAAGRARRSAPVESSRSGAVESSRAGQAETAPATAMLGDGIEMLGAGVESPAGPPALSGAPPAGSSGSDDPGRPALSNPREQAPGGRAANMGMALAWLALALLLGGVIARGLWAERAPWGNMYEFSLASALAGLGVFLLVSLRRDVRWLGIFVVPAILLTLGLAVTVLYTEAAQLVPALDSYWLIIHVSTAIMCGGAFLVAGLLALAHLASERAERPATGAWSRAVCGLGRRLPDAAPLDLLSYRIIAFAFPLWTFSVVAGAIWAESAWGRYWGWDPKETWAFITWVVYAGYLHARSTAGWKGRRAAILALIGLAVYIFNYYGVNLLIPGLHSYSGV